MSRTRSTPRISADVDAVDLAHRLEIAGIGVPDEAIGRGEVGGRRRRRGKPRDRLDQPVELLFASMVCRSSSVRRPSVSGDRVDFVSAARPSRSNTRPTAAKSAEMPALAQLHWDLYRLYSGQISRGRLGARFSRIQEISMFVTPAYAQRRAPRPDMFISILPFVLIFVIMYFLIIRPQRTQLKKRQEMLAAVRRGDTVVTGGGFVGKVTKVIDDNELEIDLGGGTKVTALRIDDRGSARQGRAGGQPERQEINEFPAERSRFGRLKERRLCSISRAGRRSDLAGRGRRPSSSPRPTCSRSTCSPRCPTGCRRSR